MSWVYALFDENIPFYVGESNHPGTRFEQHITCDLSPYNPATYEKKIQMCLDKKPVTMRVLCNTTGKKAGLIAEASFVCLFHGLVNNSLSKYARLATTDFKCEPTPIGSAILLANDICNPPIHPNESYVGLIDERYVNWLEPTAKQMRRLWQELNWNI